jgi:AraC-like DNA-binding protein
VDYHELLPAEPLRGLIRCYWFLTGGVEDRAPSADPALPDGSPELIFNLADPFQAFRDGGPPVAQPMTMLVGQITAPLVVGPTGRVDMVAVRLEAFGASILCDDLAAITNRWLGGDQLDPRLGALRTALGTAEPADRPILLDQHLSHLTRVGRQPDPRVVRAVRAIRDGNGAVTLHRLTRELGTTARTLQRLFASDVGISPKLLARITRFQRVFSAWRRDPRSLARVAAACGYYDQSHLVHDFRDFAGAAPAAFLTSQPEFTAFFTGSAKRGPTGRHGSRFGG